MRTLLLFLFHILLLSAQNTEAEQSVKLLFIGDVMGHDSQIVSAYNPKQKTYNYDSVFTSIAPIIKHNDFAIANLEVTLAGKPYKGYPRFSSPIALAKALKKNGVDVVVTANNHIADRGRKGIVRTLNSLDSCKILHTGSFRDSTERDSANVLFLEKNGIKVALLSYTFSTNGLPVPTPTRVNRLDTTKIINDIAWAGKNNPDKIILFLHWGREYKLKPSTWQKKVAATLFANGADIIIGAHPHVVQKMAFWQEKGKKSARFIGYSLGNFVSNQREKYRDGGALIQLTLSRKDNTVSISDCGYYLAWVHKQKKKGKTTFRVVSSIEAERSNFKGFTKPAKKSMQRFLNAYRELLKRENENVKEIRHEN